VFSRELGAGEERNLTKLCCEHKIDKMNRNPLWLTGVDAPIIKKHISKCFKILKKIS
jgi:hypothetical protein